jgi:hypothetical protein
VSGYAVATPLSRICSSCAHVTDLPPAIVRRAPQNERKCWLARTRRFDGPVILFQDIIEILHGTVFRVLVYRQL